jgi:outer membrane lipoprotein carrier protein
MRLILCFLLLLSTSKAAFAQDYKKLKNTFDCKSAIENHHQSLTSLSADFSEKIYSSMFDNAKKGSGKFYFKPDQKIRWELISPQKQAILIDGKTIKIIENGKVVNNPGSKAVLKKVQNIMLQMLSGDFLNEKEFKISYFENAANYKLVLVPKNERMANYLAKIELTFDKNSLLLREMSMIESETERIVYTFSNIQINKAIDNSKFTKF